MITGGVSISTFTKVFDTINTVGFSIRTDPQTASPDDDDHLAWRSSKMQPAANNVRVFYTCTTLSDEYMHAFTTKIQKWIADECDGDAYCVCSKVLGYQMKRRREIILNYE